MILLTPDEFDNLCNFEQVAKAQLKKVVDLLKSKTIKAYGGNRVILGEDWQALLKEGE